MYHYENGQLGFYAGVYPEYKDILEGALSAQYPTSSLEIVKKPKYFSKKYSDVMPLEPVKDSVYTINIYK